MANVVSDYEAKIDAVNTALSGGDYATARQRLAEARVLAAKLPDETDVAGRKVSRKEVFDFLNTLPDAINEHERAAAGFGTTQLIPLGFGRAM